jgi:uncharacterized protein (TIGR02145 family)
MTKKITLFMFLILTAIGISAEDVKILFTGSDENGNNSTLDSIVITNTRNNISETLHGTTELTFNNVVTPTSNPKLQIINESIKIIPLGTQGQKLTFNSTNLGFALINVYNVDGRNISSFSKYLQAGLNSFQMNLPSGIFVIKVIGTGYNYSIKTVNQIDNGRKSTIQHIDNASFTENNPQKAKKISNNTLAEETRIGDNILYKATDANGNIAIVVNKVSSNKNVNFNFVVCKDANGINYPTVRIGSQVWMAKNLASTKFNDGSDITLITDDEQWKLSAATPAYCYMNNNIFSYLFLGSLYNLSARESGKLAPVGWHIPTYFEYTSLQSAIGTHSVAKLMSTAPNSWTPPYAGATNEFGFSAIASGYRSFLGPFNEINYPLGTLFYCALNDDSFNLMYITNSGSFSPSSVQLNTGMSVRCIKNLSLPELSTKIPTAITASSVSSGGNVSSDGGSSITARGICWSTNPIPTIALSTKTTETATTGEYTSSITALNPGTKYYVRAYATNAAGTNYGEIVSFTTAAGLPTVTTNTVSEIAANIALSGGTVSSNGGASITGKGICWSTSTEPTIALSTKTTVISNQASFNVYMGSLAPNTKYYVRAFATNSVGTAYGEEKSFTTAAGLPLISTIAISDITINSAISGIDVSSNGGANISARGICWSTTTSPTVALSTKTSETGTTDYLLSSLTNLASNTTYYVRAYATNSAGTAYGAERSFTTLAPSLPTVTTATITKLKATTATSGGAISNDGGAPITARGVCWSSEAEPTVGLTTKTSDGTSTGNFISNITNLSPSTVYYIRAYATNSVGTAYGENILFTTPVAPVPNSDADGNVYTTVTIGTQTWMVENLRTTKYNDGTSIANSTEWGATSAGAYCWYNNDDLNKSTYGALYNWHAVNSGKLAPEGWHIATDAEWNTLIEFLGGEAIAGEKIKDQVQNSFWDILSLPASNSSGFKALGSGYREAAEFSGNSIVARWWTPTASIDDTSLAILKSVYYQDNALSSFASEKSNGCSVRCVKD